MTASKILFSIPNHEFSDVILKLQDIEDITFEIDESQEYSMVKGSTSSGDTSRAFNNLTIKDWTDIIVPVINFTAGIIGLITIIWPSIKKDSNPGITINNTYVPIDKSLTEKEVIELVRSELEKAKPQPKTENTDGNSPARLDDNSKTVS